MVQDPQFMVHDNYNNLVKKKQLAFAGQVQCRYLHFRIFNCATQLWMSARTTQLCIHVHFICATFSRHLDKDACRCQKYD